MLIHDHRPQTPVRRPGSLNEDEKPSGEGGRYAGIASVASIGMECLDATDRMIIAALQQDGRASWAKIGRICGTSVPTASRRARRLIEEGAVAIGVIPELGYNGPVEQFFTWIKCEAGHHAKVAETVASRDEVRFAALTTGDFDIIAELILPRSPRDQTRVMLELAGIDGVASITTDLIPKVHKISHDWSLQLLQAEQHTGHKYQPHRCDPSHFDAPSRVMIEMMKADPRISFRELSKNLHLDESTTRRKFLRLRQRGCVTVATLVPASTLGFESEANLSIRVKPKKMSRVVERLRDHKSVRYLASLLNGNTLLCEAITESSDELYKFTSEDLAGIDGVEGWRAAIELMTVKRGFIRTPWAGSSASGVATQGLGKSPLGGQGAG